MKLSFREVTNRKLLVEPIPRGTNRDAVNADSTAEKREYSYDAWGNLRHHTDWLDNDPDYELIADRGYTGHEHLTEFGLINMNGRVYDPVIGRFLSPDPFVQAPGQVDGYNRYAYCLNNPMKYVDPSGYVFERERSWGLWGIKPQQDSGGHGKTGGGTTMGSQISSAGGSNSSSGSGIGGYSWAGGNHYYDGNGNSVTWQEAIEGTYQYLYGDSFFDNLNYADRETRKGKRLKISISGALATGRGLISQSWQFGHPHIDISWVTVNVAANGGGPGWEPYAGTAGAVAGEMFYSKTYGTWMGKNFKMYQQTWGGNGFTGGKLKFGKKVSTGFKIGGYGLGIWNAYSVNSQHSSGQITDGQMYMEQGSNVLTTVGGLYGAAWGVGWELGRAITNTGWYQEAKFNFWYNRWESQVGSPSQSNEALWYYFYQNYKP